MEIEDEASFCHHCNMHQVSWKNWLPSVSNYIAIILFIASIFVWSLDQSTNFLTTITWKDDVEVILFDSSSALVLRNKGDGDVFVERIDVKTHGHAFSIVKSITIGDIIKKGQIGTIKLRNEVHGDLFWQKNKISRPDFEKKLANLTHSSEKEIKKVVFSKNHAKWKTIEANARDIIYKLDGKATIYYHSVKNDSILFEEFDCVVLFVKQYE